MYSCRDQRLSRRVLDHESCTHRRLEVGADATDARTDRPGSDGSREFENALAPFVPSELLSSELDARSGRVVEY